MMSCDKHSGIGGKPRSCISECEGNEKNDITDELRCATENRKQPNYHLATVAKLMSRFYLLQYVATVHPSTVRNRKGFN
jgi:hypothetical protein